MNTFKNCYHVKQFKHIILIFCLFTCFACFPYKKTIARHSKDFKKNHPQDFKSHHYKNRPLSYIYHNPNKLSHVLVFVHGSPGSWKSFIHFLDQDLVSNNFGVLLVDRPGFGQHQRLGSVNNLGLQAKMLNGVLEHALDSTQHRVLLIGHSYGGPLIAQMLIEASESVFNMTHGLYFLAASVDPELEKTKWFQYPAQWLILKWAIPYPLIHSNEEILALKNDLKNQTTRLQKIQHKDIYVLHGEKDNLVPIENVAYLQKHLPILKENITRLKDTNHFIPWSHDQLIIETALMWKKKNMAQHENKKP